MHRGLAAFAAAALLAIGVRAPATAQSCESFGSQKEAQQALEQTGDTTGMLDPDLNGYACEGAFGGDAQEAGAAVGDVGTVGDDSAVDGATGEPGEPSEPGPMTTELVGAERVLSSGLALNQYGPVISDAAAGASGVTTEISSDNGRTEELAEPGAEAETPLGVTEDGTLAAGDAAVSPEGDAVEAAAGDAVAVDGPTNDTAVAGDAAAVDEHEPMAVKPKPELGATADEAPVKLPNTGVGPGSARDGSLSLLLTCLALGAVLLAGRRVQGG